VKRFILFGSAAIFALAVNASAQTDAARVNAARAAIDTTPEFRGDAEYRQDRDVQKANIHVGAEIDKLNRDVQQLRADLSGNRSSRIRERFDRLTRDTDQLNAAYRKNRIRLSDAYRRTEDLRAEAQRIRKML
jgi:Ni/Co efflux regulator RcnB